MKLKLVNFYEKLKSFQLCLEFYKNNALVEYLREFLRPSPL